MTNQVIDASDRFRAAPAIPADASEIKQNWKDRQHRQEREAAELRKQLTAIARLDIADRKIIVRNLGRAIERKHDGKPTSIVSQLFRNLYGEEGGPSKEKKRKRYIRFDGEPLNDHAAGEEYAANGREFLRLIEGLADLLDHNMPQELARDQMLLFVCDGTSFYGPSRPRLQLNISLNEKFRQTIDALIDRIVRETDIVEYLDEVQNYAIKTLPHSMDDVEPEVIENLHHKTFPVQKFEHLPEHDDAYDVYSRLRLGGFDIRVGTPSPLYPRMRLARIYWPRQVLCLPAFVTTSSLDEIRSRNLSESEIADALQEYEPILSLDQSEEDIRRSAIREWRDLQEYKMWRDALKEAGYNPDTIDWSSFESELDGTALNGAEWRTFWQAMSVDLHLIADGRTDALHFGLSFGGGSIGHWTDAPKDLSQPQDDDVANTAIECSIYDEIMHFVPWLPAGKKTQVCRGFVHVYSSDSSVEENEELVFDEFDAHAFRELTKRQLWSLQQDAIWNLLTMNMKHWQKEHYSFGSQHPRKNETASLRPLFSAPDGWTPAPDGSLASAILRSLAYGEGSERLDEKFIAEINNLIRCFRDMKEELSLKFQEGLSHHGYAD